LLSRENWIGGLLVHLKNNNIQSLIVEGGKQILEQFLAVKLFDEVRIFKSSTFLGMGLLAPKFDKSDAEITNVGASTDKLLTIRPNDTSNYF
jgi:diaminohydroxyphosphoribosylaminopyrimidine deaminase/5-amino-6-(5-phosphoribosylamino)uracil reductase